MEARQIASSAASRRLKDFARGHVWCLETEHVSLPIVHDYPEWVKQRESDVWDVFRACFYERKRAVVL